jgi:hypothetical protein
MGIFRNLKSIYKKSEGAVVVQNLLEHYAKRGLFDLDAAAYANKLMELVWQVMPDVFEGKFGQRPYKLSAAAIALANGVGFLENGVCILDEADFRYGNIFQLALGDTLIEAETNGHLYPLNNLDYHLLGRAMEIYKTKSDKDAETPIGKQMAKLFGKSL